MKRIKSKIGQLSFDESESILHVEIFEEAEMNMANLADHNRAILKVSGGKKHIALVDVRVLYFIDAEGVKFAADSEAYEKRAAIAFYGDSLSHRLNITLLKMQENISFPINIFKTKEEALGWIKEFKETANLQ